MPYRVLLACLLLLVTAEARAEVKLHEKEIGFQGHFRPGCWAPVTLRLQAVGEAFQGQIELRVGDPDDMTAVFTYPVSLPADAPQTCRFLVRPKRSSHGVRVRLIREGERQRTARWTIEDPGGLTGMEQHQKLILVLGRAPGLREALTAQNLGERYRLVPVGDPDRLPTRWAGYECVEAIVCATDTAGLFTPELAPQRQAIQQWVAMGGRLILSTAEAWKTVSDHWGNDLLPSKLTAPVDLNAAARALEAYADSKEALPGTPALRVAGVQFDAKRRPDLRVWCELTRGRFVRPLVASRPYRFGLVTLVAFDVDREPFAVWKGRIGFWAALLNLNTADTAEQTDKDLRQTALTREVFSDVSLDLKGYLDRVEGVSLIPFSIVAVLILGYILLIGPIDYFFLKKGLRRLELTWISFTVIVIAVSIVAVGIARANKGDRMRVRQVDLIDVDLTGPEPVARGVTWCTVFSARNDSYNVRLDDEPGAVIGWLGRTSTTLGGSYRRSGAALPQGSYNHGIQELRNVPIRIWSTKSFEARWTGPAKFRFPGTLTAAEGHFKRRAKKRIWGSFTNDTGYDLTDCYLAYADRVYQLGKVPAGSKVVIGPRLRPEGLGSWMAQGWGRKLDEEGSKDAPQYKPGTHDADPGEPLRVMMLYDFGARDSRAREYLQTQDGPVRSDRFVHVDQSHQLQHRRAVFVGTTRQGGARLKIDGWDGQHHQRHTVIRAILPIGVQ